MRFLERTRVPLAPLIAALLLACRPRGAVEGDVYFADSRGAPVRAAGVTVLLLHGGDSAMAAISRTCQQHMAASTRLKTREIEALSNSSAPGADPTSTAALTRLAQYQPIMNAIRDTIRDLSKETIERVQQIVERAVDDSVITHIDAHYRFNDVPPGHYVVLARGEYGGDYRAWVAPAIVKARHDTVVDLNPKADQSREFLCWITPEDLTGADINAIAVARTAQNTLAARQKAARDEAAAERRAQDSARRAIDAEVALNARLPWIADRDGLTYYRAGCDGMPGIPFDRQRRFRSEAEARAAGFRHTALQGC